MKPHNPGNQKSKTPIAIGNAQVGKTRIHLLSFTNLCPISSCIMCHQRKGRCWNSCYGKNGRHSRRIYFRWVNTITNSSRSPWTRMWPPVRQATGDPPKIMPAASRLHPQLPKERNFTAFNKQLEQSDILNKEEETPPGHTGKPAFHLGLARSQQTHGSTTNDHEQWFWGNSNNS